MSEPYNSYGNDIFYKLVDNIEEGKLKRDKIVGVDASKEISERIIGSNLFIYEEAKDFNSRVINFLGGVI